MYCYSPNRTMASPLQPNVKEIYTYTVYKKNKKGEKKKKEEKEKKNKFTP